MVLKSNQVPMAQEDMKQDTLFQGIIIGNFLCDP